ncbi:hypothetical protein P9274_20020 [Schinkia azotoformans]|uniref:hypothetical protein n=1 Tax=Schinkia azotoformans TaxID=1454 RepID=UPI002E1B4F37|nr:hypothetical protein [Schinkia azotoformans]
MNQKEISFELKPYMDDAPVLNDFYKSSLLNGYQELIDKSIDESKSYTTRLHYSGEAFGFRQALTMLGYEIVEKVGEKN